MNITAEELAYWYLRLNGFLTINGFVVHPDQGRRQRTEVDFIAARFPFRSELETNPMVDDPLLVSDSRKIRLILGEVKTSRCVLNGPWNRREARNMQLVLRALGSFPLDRIEDVAQALYSEGLYEDEFYLMNICCIGNEKNIDVEEKFPLIPQILWDQVANFIFERFRTYQQKIEHPQWNTSGKQLWVW